MDENLKQTSVQKRVGGRSARVREAVIAAALEELASRGYEQFSISLVARSAGVHETSIYRRWGTRDALILDTLHAAHMAPIPDTGNLYADLCQLLRNTCELMNSALGRSLLQLAASVQPASTFHPVMKEFWQARIPALEAVFVRAIERGEWDPAVTYRLHLDALLGAVIWRVNVTQDGVTGSDIEALVGMHCRIDRARQP
jgi:AcrR family transcriptional regulator